MSQENVELARQFARSWNDGIDAFLEYLDPDVEWRPTPEGPLAGVYRGHDGVRDYVGRLREVFDEMRIEPLEVIDIDDNHVIVVNRIIARSESSGMEIDAKWASLITLGPNKKAVRFETFTDKAQALEAIGLRE